MYYGGDYCDRTGEDSLYCFVGNRLKTLLYITHLFFVDLSEASLLSPSSAGSLPIAKVKSLTHYGEPYDGNTRFFRSSLFVAAVRASYGEACLLHGVPWMPPKVMLQALCL